MQTSEVLARVRVLVAAGWHEPLSLTDEGRICAPQDRALARVCLFDALQLGAHFNGAGHMVAEAALLKQARVASWLDLQAWLEAPARTHAEVLQLITRAQSHTAAEETR
jgi:hypothetical protein